VIDGLFHDDGREHVALAALAGDDIVGLGRYDADTTTRDAEMSVTVEGRHQRRGIGTLLARELVLLARAAHLRRVRMTVDPGDERPAALLRRAALDPIASDDRGRLVLECGGPRWDRRRPDPVPRRT
jgi:GNAT superfamily N-acetyltransferase